MDREEKEKWIDKLLVFMNDEVDNYGHGVKAITFNFSENIELDEHFHLFNENNPISFENFSQVMNICISRKYVRFSAMGGGRYDWLQLTESGQGVAISSLKQDKSLSELGDINIGTLNSNGVAQIGNNNVLNIENMLINLVEQIEKSDATDDEKKQAKSKLKAFLEHPVTKTILGASVGVILAKMGL